MNINRLILGNCALIYHLKHCIGILGVETVTKLCSKSSFRPNTVGKLVKLYVLCAANVLILVKLELQKLGRSISREEAQR